MAKLMREYDDDVVYRAVKTHTKFPQGGGVHNFDPDLMDIEVHPIVGGGHRVTVTMELEFDGEVLLTKIDRLLAEDAQYRR